MEGAGWDQEALEQAIARDGIRDLVARYNSYGDSGRFDQLVELFTADAVMDLTRDDEPLIFRGREEIKSIFTGVRDRIQEEPDHPSGSYIRHFTSTHRIDLIQPGRAEGRAYFAVLMDHGLDHWGRYQDRYVRQGGLWRFEHRRVITEGWVAASRFAR